MTKHSRKYNNKNVKKSKKSKKYKGGGNRNYISAKNFTTGDINGKTVKGLVHVTEAVGINVARGFGTGVANFFGSKGFESELYDTVKTNAFKKLQQQIPDKYTVGNIKLDIETTNATIFCHLVGTVYE